MARRLAVASQKGGVGKTTVARILREAGYRLQATFKTKEGAQNPDRDAQFRHINAVAGMFLAVGDPVTIKGRDKHELAGGSVRGGRAASAGGVRDRGRLHPAVDCGASGRGSNILCC